MNLVEVYARNKKQALSTVSTYSSGSGDFYARLKAGHDLTTRRAARVAQWLSDHWPDDLAWPAEIPRPARSIEAGEVNGAAGDTTPRRATGKPRKGAAA